MAALTNDLLVKVCSYITDPITITDELIPSGEAFSYRSNPERLSEFALSRRDPQYATKRYRSNCINWGMTPFLVENPEVFALGDYIFVPNVRAHVLANDEQFPAYDVKSDGTVTQFSVSTGALMEAERQTIADGCLINYCRNHGLETCQYPFPVIFCQLI